LGLAMYKNNEPSSGLKVVAYFRSNRRTG